MARKLAPLYKVKAGQCGKAGEEVQWVSWGGGAVGELGRRCSG